MAEERRNQRSSEAAAFHKWYKTARWQAIRKQQLQAHPLCERHLKRNQVVPATVVHHRLPHKGDWALFSSVANLESLCKPCHDSEAQSEERTGYSKQIDGDGWPADPRHPANR